MENPSDLITRKQIIDLNSSKLWWEGPIFLKEHDIFENKDVIEIDITEVKRENTFVCLSDIKDKVDLNELLNINKYSNFKKLVRITSWVLRFVNNIKKKSEVCLTHLKANELKIAEEHLIKSNQKNLLNEKNISKYNYLNLTIDQKDLIRRTGRLSLAPLPYETRSPILLDSYHPLTKLIILNIHERNKRIGYKHTLTEFRQRFWIVQGRKLVRNLLRKCIICKKIEGKSYAYPPFPPLTALQLKDSHPFDTTGVDNFGPLFVKEVFYEKNDDKMYKAWVTFYACASTRAILLDLVPRQSSTSFINSFRRMIVRRGCPNNIISDNGKKTLFLMKPSRLLPA